MVYEEIANYINEVGINKSAIARKIGMSKQVFGNCLSGDRKITADEYVAICEALQVPVSKFVPNQK